MGAKVCTFAVSPNINFCAAERLRRNTAYSRVGRRIAVEILKMKTFASPDGVRMRPTIDRIGTSTRIGH